MRLLIFSPYFPPHVGGVEGYVRDLNLQLIRDGMVDQIVVLAPRIPADAARHEQLAPRYEVVRYPAFEAIPNFPIPALWRRGFWQAARIALRRGDHDVVVCHTRFFVSTLLAVAFSRVARLPLIHVEHGSDHAHLSSPRLSAAARAYDLTVGRLVLGAAQAIVAVSQAAAIFVQEISGRQGQVIYRGVDHARYEAVRPCPDLLAWAAGRPVVSFVGRLIDGKGVADLIEGFARLEASQALLCLVGDGPRRAELERLCAERGIADRCLFTGYQPEQRALQLMRASDVVVNPSYTEGLPTSVLEAALLGRCILASDVGGTPEIVEHGKSALLVGAGRIGDLHDGLELLLASGELRARLGQTARQEAARRFDPHAGAQSFISLAGALASGRRGRAP